MASFDETVHLFWTAISYKRLHRSTSSLQQLHYLVTGSYGEQTFLRKLDNAGPNPENGSRRVFAIFDAAYALRSQAHIDPDDTFDVIVQIIAHPFVGISNLLILKPTYPDQLLPLRRSQSNRSSLYYAMIHWFVVHSLVETFAHRSIPIHEIGEGKAPIIFRTVDPQAIKHVLKEHGRMLSEADLSWIDLQHEESSLASLICQLSVRFGFGCGL